MGSRRLRCWISPLGLRPLSAIQHHSATNRYFSVNYFRLLLQFAKILLILLLVPIVLVSCKSKTKSNDPNKNNNNSFIKEDINSEFLNNAENQNIFYNDNKNDTEEEEIFIKNIDIPKNYVKIIRNGKLYVYDTEGNSLIASKEKKYDDFSDLSKKDYFKILGSNFSDVRLLNFDKISIIGKNTIRIKFESTKNDKTILNICYYLDCENNGIKIVIQAKSNKILDKLDKTIETIKLD